MESDAENDMVSNDFVDILQNSLWISSPEWSGWLTKRSSNWFVSKSLLLKGRYAWQRKWVSLHGTELVYMDKEPTVENMKHINIRRSQITATTVVVGDDHETTGFTIFFNVEHMPEWHFRADSTEEKANWLIKLSQVHAITSWLDEYERVKVLGIGGQGTVYELVHRTTGKRLAMKEMEISSDKQMQLAISEALFLKSIVENVSHPNIMRIEKVFQVGSKFYLAFPLCTGGELYEAVASRGHFTEHDAGLIIHDLVSALHALHTHDILHLDIKPENILFESKDPHSRIVLTDFGLSKLFSEEEMKNVNNKDRVFHEHFHEHIEAYIQRGDIEAAAIRGTNGYMSPEVIVDGYYTKAADVFATGVVLYILLCGYPPFYSRSTRQTFLKTVRGIYRIEGPEWDTVSDEAKDLMKRMLAVDPADRITTEEILQHPWILSATGAAPTISTVPLQSPAILPSSFSPVPPGREHPSEAVTTVIASAIEDNSEKLSSKFSTTSTNTDDSLSMITAAMSPPKRRNSITENPSIRHANMSNALSHLAHHIQSLKADKMASTMTRFFSMAGKGAGSSRLAETYLVPINQPEIKNKEEKTEVNEVPITSLMLLISEDVREALGETIFEHFGSDKNRLTIEEFVNVRRKFGFLPPNASNGGTVNAVLNSNVGELLLIKLVDRDNDGYISAEDIYTFQVLLNQKNESLLSAVFRIYTEALWYPGRNVNYLNTIQRINFKGSNSSVAATISQHLSTIPSMLGRGTSFVGESPQISPPPTENGISPPGKSDGIAATGSRPPSRSMDDKYDVVEPPKFITAKNVAAVFEKFGYNPKHAETVFNVLCETLQRIRLARPSNRPASLSELQQEEQEQETAENLPRDSTASKDSDDDDEEELKKASESSIWKRFTLRSGSTTTSETGGGVDSDSVKNVKKHRMDANDFIRACRIDDVLVQVLFHQQQRRLYAIIEKAENRLQQEVEKQKKLPIAQRVDVKLSTILREELKQSFQENEK
jgi:serine/threonine protein kinase